MSSISGKIAPIHWLLALLLVFFVTILFFGAVIYRQGYEAGWQDRAQIAVQQPGVH